jgi:hypothetical protein
MGVADGTSTAPGVGTDGTEGTVVDDTVVDDAAPDVVLPGEESAQAGPDATRGSPIMARTTSLLACLKGWVRVDVKMERPPLGSVACATGDDSRGVTSRRGGR